MISPAITAIVIAVLAALAFGGGFAVSDWRAGAERVRLTSSNATLKAANDKCAIDIGQVRAAMEQLLTVAAKQEKSAKDAMKEAEPVAQTHTAKAIKIKRMSPIPKAEPDQCKAIIAEQIKYVQERRDL